MSNTVSRSVIGSGNYLEIFNPAAAACGWADTSAFIFDRSITMDIIGHPAIDKLTIELESEIDNKAYNTFVNSFMTSATVEDVETSYANGAKCSEPSGVDASNPFIFAFYGATDNDNERKIVTGRGIITSDNAFNYADKKRAATKVSIKTISGLEVKVAAAKFCTSLVSGAGDIVIDSQTKGCVSYMTAV